MRNKKGEVVYQRQYIAVATAHPHKLSVTYQPIEKVSRTQRQRHNEVNLQDTDHEGIMSLKARKRIEVALQWLLFISKPKRISAADTGKSFSFKVNFITLTLPSPQQHTDEEIKQVCLKNFLDRMAKTHGLNNYIWRAEAQANGNIHFHLTTDTYIHYNTIRKVWNDCVELLGYVSRYEEKWHNRNPNSTDVHAVKHVKNLAAYLSKYISKHREFTCIGELRNIKGEVIEVLYGTDAYRREDANQKVGKVIGHVLGGRVRRITGRLWMCSRSLSKMKGVRVDEETFDFVSIQDLIQKGDLREYQGEFCNVFFGDVVTNASKYSWELYKLLQQCRS